MFDFLVRPPTPPRELNQSPMPDLLLKQPIVWPALDPRRSLQTPPSAHCPASAITNSAPSSRRSRKSVAFAAQPPPSADIENRVCPSSGPLVPSAQASKPSKSILKPFLSPNPLDISFNSANGAATPRSLITMLESSAKQLAGEDRMDRMDAYTALSRALRASNNLPDRVALQNKMPRFMGFIQRDITASPLDSSLAIHALEFLGTILHFPGIASALTTEFAMFVVDHYIKAFGAKGVPKDVMRHLLQIAAQQDFSPRVMTSDRVGRLVAALMNIEQNVTGKSIIHGRLQVYKRLLKQCKTHMVAHNGWLRDLLNDSLSTNKDIRGAAIVLGYETAFTIGKNRQISSKIAEIFRTTHGEERYFDYYTTRLRNLLKAKQEPYMVPQIWSNVLLLLRGISLENWQFLNTWLKLIQSCFNASDMKTREQANYAWNRFVYVMHFIEPSFAKMQNTFRQPMCSQWKRKGLPARDEEAWQRIVLGSACNLFYYAFKPGASPGLLDSAWDHALKPIVGRLCRARYPEVDEAGMSHAIAILTTLFDSTTRRQWIEDRVETNILADVSELPAVDPKWLRRNATRLFDILDPILLANLADLSDPKSPVSRMWQILIASVASAASKEIKVSLETSEFVSRMFTTLAKLWNGLEKRKRKERKGFGAAEGREEEEEENGDFEEELEQERVDKLAPVFLSSIREFLMTAVLALGVLPFTEKKMACREGAFTAIATPSHRTPKHPGLVKLPVYHLFSMLASAPQAIADNDAYYAFLRTVFNPFFKARGHRAPELAQEMLASIPVDSPCSYGIWYLVATLSVASTSAGLTPGSQSQNSAASEPPVGGEYREVCRILERGLKSTPNLPWARWESIFKAFEDRVVNETGDPGCALAIIEPLAKATLENGVGKSDGNETWAVQVATVLLNLASQPRDRQAMDAARRRLWGAAGSKAASFDPYDSLYKLLNAVMKNLYEGLVKADTEHLSAHFLKEMEAFLGRCNKSLVLRTLSILQDGLVPWVKDPEERLSTRQLAATTEAAKQVWDRISEILRSQETPEKMQLGSIEPLLCAAFQSRHRHVVNTVTIVWNHAFDNVENIRYPDGLKATLVSVRPLLDIILPGIDESSSESAAQRGAFIDSQDDMDVLNLSPVRSSFRDQVRLASSGSSALAKSPAPAPAASADTPKPGSGQTRRTKLRHEYSQIRFAVIDMSPPTKHLESQVLTERQQEVRERQRQQAALFDIRSSSPGSRKPAMEVPEEEAVESPALPIAMPSSPETPKGSASGQRDYEDYISSTPTPRRGQLLPIDHDVDMSDMPSSPPEVSEIRRYPLAEEIRSRSIRKNDIAAWRDLSSSPVSGSPLPQNRVIVHEQEEVDAEDEGEEGEGEGEDDSLQDLDETRIQESVVEDSFAIDVVPSSVPLADAFLATTRELSPANKQTVKEEPCTPPSQAIVSVKAPESPRSDNEYMDALQSPQKTMPSRTRARRIFTRSSQSDEPSYGISPSAEKSMLRVADEAIADRAGKEAITKRARKGTTPVMDCITVLPMGEDEDETWSQVMPSTPDTKTGSQRWKRPTSGSGKRKRRASKCYDTRTKKRRSIFDALDDEPSSSVSGGSPSHQASIEVEEVGVPNSIPRKASPGDRSDPASSDPEEEVQSQVIQEHIAASRSQSRASPEIASEFPSPPHPHDIEAAMRSQSMGCSHLSPASRMPCRSSSRKLAVSVETHLRVAQSKLRAGTVTRDEMNRIEDMFADFKRDLYDAYGRGREQQQL